MKDPTPLIDYHSGATRLITGLPFDNGDEMNQPAFHERYERAPKGFRAELVNGIVVFKMPITPEHERPHANVYAWLLQYSLKTPGTTARLPLTLKLGLKSEPEPDACMLLDGAMGGQTRIDDSGYLAGPPELVVEIANSTHSYDLGNKKRDYERYGVKEYLALIPGQKTAIWFAREGRFFRAIDPSPEGTLRSRFFPGLWLSVRDAFLDSPRALLRTLRRGLASSEHKRFVSELNVRRKSQTSPKRHGKSK